MSVTSEAYRTLKWPSRRSASLPRRPSLRQRQHNNRGDLWPYSNDVLPPVTTLPSSLRSYTPSTRDVSHEPSAAVDPKLRDAQKLGGNYHITLNLNSLLNHPVNVAYNEAVTSATDYMMPRSPSSLSLVSAADPYRRPRGLTQLRRRTAINTGGVGVGGVGGGRRMVARMSVCDDEQVNGHHPLQLMMKGRRSTMIADDDDDGYVIQSVMATSSSLVVNSRPQSIEQHQDEGGFVIRAVTPSCSSAVIGAAQREERRKEDDMVSFDLQLIGLDSSSSSSSKMQQTSYIVNDAKEAPAQVVTDERMVVHRSTTEPQRRRQRRQQTLNDDDDDDDNDDDDDDVDPMYTMTIDETMTMDYYPPAETPPSPSPSPPAAAAADSRRSVAKQAKSKMPLPPPSRSMGHSEGENEMTPYSVHPLSASSSVHPLSVSSSVHPLSVSSSVHPASAASFFAAGVPLKSRATHRKVPIPAKKDSAEEHVTVVQKAGRRPPNEVHGSIVIDRWSPEQWKRMRNITYGSNEGCGFVVSDEALKARYLGRPRPDLSGRQGLMSTSSHRSFATFDEADGVIIIAPAVQSETLTEAERDKATGRRRRMAGGSDEEFHTEIKVSRGSTRIETRGSDVTWHTGTMASLAKGLRDQQRSGQSAMPSSYVRRLMKDAPPQGSVHQRFDIEEQKEEVVIGQTLEDKAAAANSFSSSSGQTSTHNLLNADFVSEQVDVRLENGFANLVVKVTCERLVPIHGSAHNRPMYKKLSITISRFIDVDLTVTGERRRIYDQVMGNRLPSGNLSNRDTFELYIAFMQLAELHPSPELDQQQLWIDKKVDENKLTKYASLENQFGVSDGTTTLASYSLRPAKRVVGRTLHDSVRNR